MKTETKATRKANKATRGTDAPDANAPTLAEALAANPVNTAPTEAVIVNPAPGEFDAVLAELRAAIQSNGKVVIGWYVQRGALVAKAIDIKLRKATNNATRIKLRKAGLDAAQLTALDAYDPESEPSPNADMWLRLHWLVKLVPSAQYVVSVEVARALCNMITRIDPPNSWPEGERWEIKRQYLNAIDAIVDRAIKEKLNRDDVRALIDAVDGIGTGPAPKAKSSDNVKAARAAASRIAKQFSEGKVNPETFFDELKTHLEKLGWRLQTSASGGTTATRPGRSAK